MRMRVTAVFEYDVVDPIGSYGSEDPTEIARIDKDAMEDDPGTMLDLAGEWKLAIEPVDANLAWNLENNERMNGGA